LILGSLLLTVRDYSAYSLNPEVAYAFESAAAGLAQQLNEEAPGTAIYVDEHFWSSLPSISFLVTDPMSVNRYLSPNDLPEEIDAPAAIYAWPYSALDFVPELMDRAALISVTSGELARTDLDKSAYSLYVRYGLEELPETVNEPLATFADRLSLHQANVIEMGDGGLQVDLYWQAEMALDEELVVFVHVAGPEGLVGQDDNPPADGRWQKDWWRAGQIVRDRHTLYLDEPYDPGKHEILVGLYEASTGERLPVTSAEPGETSGATVTIGHE
jgi:hypothetical protein